MPRGMGAARPGRLPGVPESARDRDILSLTPPALTLLILIPPDYLWHWLGRLRSLDAAPPAMTGAVARGGLHGGEDRTCSGRHGHPDDAEAGAGGTIAKLVKQGADVTCVVVTNSACSYGWLFRCFQLGNGPPLVR
ncbi:MAG TPA: PIG-L family deacetylase [Dehalococcoidia bacterium]|nr:PIG-L family deacetylase [Dehalococcoidia bacterium]